MLYETVTSMTVRTIAGTPLEFFFFFAHRCLQLHVCQVYLAATTFYAHCEPEVQVSSL